LLLPQEHRSFSHDLSLLGLAQVVILFAPLANFDLLIHFTHFWREAEVAALQRIQTPSFCLFGVSLLFSWAAQDREQK
jgi:peptidoglycan biosynthesis protein MviN/MurJ (putative lipid II flippase)